MALIDPSQCPVRQCPVIYRAFSPARLGCQLLGNNTLSAKLRKRFISLMMMSRSLISLKILLEAFGFAVQSYSSGNEFLADERRHAAGCLVIDQHMPGMNGLDVIDNLQKEGNKVATILISGHLDTKTRERAIRLGVRELLEKPFSASRLIELVRRMLLETD